MKSRKVITKLVWTVLFTLLTYQCAIGQDLILKPNPELINSPDEILGTTDYARGATKWYVFSDRSGNKAYSESGSVQTSNIKLLEKFNVIEETADRVKVVRPDSRSVVGWIPKTHLILLDHCKRKPNRVSEKAMIINTVENFDQADQYKFYYDPALNNKNRNEKHMVYEILYVYKDNYQDSTLLLGKREDCSTDPSKYMEESIIGWIHMSLVTGWDSRGCIQPNFNPPACGERRQKDQRVVIIDTNASYNNSMSLAKGYETQLKTYSNLTRYCESFEKNPIIWNEESCERWAPSKFRLPYLSKSRDQGIMKVGVLGDITTEDGQKILDLMEVLREKARIDQEKNKLNVVFVIDGTASMKSYFPVVASSIERSMSIIRNDPDFSDVDNPNKIDINYGAVVYRDAAEVEYAVEVAPLQSYNGTKNWINSNFDNNKNLNDLDLPEAMNYGLFHALEEVLAEREGENNLVILIGDAGDHQRGDWTHIETDEIIQSLVDKNCHFIAFQTHWKDPGTNPDNQSYTDFCNQVYEIAEKSAQQISLKKQISDRLDVSGIQLTESESNSDYTLYSLNKSILANKVLCNKGHQMDTDVLSSLIIEAVKQSSQNVAKMNKIIHGILYSGLSEEDILKKYDIDPEAGTGIEAYFATISYVVDMLNQRFPDRDVTREGGELDQILQGKLQLYFEGITPLKIEGASNNLWAFEIMAITQSKRRLEKDFLRVINVFKTGSEETRRGALYDAFLELARTYAGDVRNYDDLELGVLFAKIIDFPELRFSMQYRDCLSKRIRDIKLEQNCPNDCLNVYYRAIMGSYTNLKKLSYNEYVTDAFGTFTAYWIPIELMPFVK